MTLIPFAAWHYLTIAETVYAWTGVDRHPDPAILGARFETDGPGYTAVQGSRIVACAGVMIPWSGLGFAWAVVTDEARQWPCAVHRATRRALEQITRDYTLRRVEASVQADQARNIRWARALGFGIESEMKGWGPRGETFLKMVRFP
jgi:hypothetical protein